MNPPQVGKRLNAWRRERLLLGYAGLLPFMAGLAALGIAEEPDIRHRAAIALQGYAAVVASFLGAVHWGLAADLRDGHDRARLRWGVTPAVIAWGLLLLPAGIAMGGFAVLFALILVVDRFMLPTLDQAYQRLRLQLSVVAILGLISAAFLAPAAPH